MEYKNRKTNIGKKGKIADRGIRNVLERNGVSQRGSPRARREGVKAWVIRYVQVSVFAEYNDSFLNTFEDVILYGLYSKPNSGYSK